MSEFKLPDVGEGLTEAEIVTWKVKVGDVDQGQRHRGRDRDRQVAGRAAVAVRRHGAGAARARGRDGRRSARRSSRIGDGAAPAAPAPALDREPTPTSGWPRRPAPRRDRDRHVEPGRDRRRREPDAWSATATGRRGPAPAAPRRGEPVDRRRRGRPAAAPGRVRPGRPGRRADVGRGRRAGRARPPPAPARAGAAPPSTSGCWPSRRSASSPRTSASTSRTLTPTGPDGTVTREDVAGRAGGSAPAAVGRAVEAPAAAARPDGRARAPRADQGRPQDDGAGDGATPRSRAPHVTEWITVDVTRTMKLVERLKAHREFRDVKVSPLLVRRQGGLPGDAAYAGDQRDLGRGGPGGRLQVLRQPRHRRRHPARAGRPERQGRRRAVAARARRGASTS